MQVIIAPTEDGVLGESTSLSADMSSGTTTLSVDNAQGFSADEHIAIEKIGNEKAELKQISSVDTNNDEITLKNSIQRAHKENREVQVILYDQRKFYRSSSEDGSYTHLDSEGSPVDIEVDKPAGTRFEDSQGGSNDWYKSTYYNSTTATETQLSDSTPSQAGETDHYTSLYAIRKRAGFEDNPEISEDLVADFRLEAESQFDSEISTLYSVPLSITPDIVTHIVTNLAAGNLLSKEYGIEADVEISKSGERMIERAQDLIEKIQKGTIKLVNEEGSVITTTDSFKADYSNKYDDAVDKGELFNLGNEPAVVFTDPDSPRS